MRADEERTRLLASEQAARTQAEKPIARRIISRDRLPRASHAAQRNPRDGPPCWNKQPPRRSHVKGGSVDLADTRTLAQLVDDLLDVSRMISGKMRLDAELMIGGRRRRRRRGGSSCGRRERYRSMSSSSRRALDDGRSDTAAASRVESVVERGQVHAGRRTRGCQRPRPGW